MVVDEPVGWRQFIAVEKSTPDTFVRGAGLSAIRQVNPDADTPLVASAAEALPIK